MESVWQIDIDKLVRWVLPLPSGALLICLLLSLIFNFEQSTNTHCKEAANYLPSISAAIGGFSPQRYIWQLSIALHCMPRYLLGVCYHHIYAAGSCDIASNRWLYVGLICVMTVAYYAEISCLLLICLMIGWMCATAWHEKSFIGFVVSAEMYMIATIGLCRWRRALPNFSATDAKSLRIKTFMFAANLVCCVIGGILFLHHNKYCKSGVYTGFAACEYAVVMANICFHLTCAVFDLRNFSFCVVRRLSPPPS